MDIRTTKKLVGATLALTLGSSLLIAATIEPPINNTSYIVSASTLADARAAVDAVDGTVDSELQTIKAVTASLTEQQVTKLNSLPIELTVFADRTAIKEVEDQ